MRFPIPILAVLSLTVGLTLPSSASSMPQGKPISFAAQIKPILRKRCQGCHQPANQGGKLVLTTFQALRAGGANGVAFKPGKPEESLLLKVVVGDPPSMPKNAKPLSTSEVDLLRRWIAEGAKDDTPTVKDPIDAEHPPVYESAPVLSAIAFSPDGSLLAVGGYREVLLHSADGSKLLARLVGKSPRIESLAFSPDGKTLAVSGGAPARFGEVQFWNIAEKKLIQSVDVSYDVTFGISYSPDGTRVCVGSADNSVRVLTAPEGKVLQKFDNHSDWILSTTWATDNKHFLSTGRDRAIKLVVAENGSFVDDINTHTSPYRIMVRHPKLDQVLVGGDDGTVRLYQVFRTKSRTMNQEDHNLLKQVARGPSIVHALAFKADGSQFAAAGESGSIELYTLEDGALKSKFLVRQPTYTLSFSPDGTTLAAGGFDGVVRLVTLATGTVKEFVPVPLAKAASTKVGAAR